MAKFSKGQNKKTTDDEDTIPAQAMLAIAYDICDKAGVKNFVAMIHRSWGVQTHLSQLADLQGKTDFLIALFTPIIEKALRGHLEDAVYNRVLEKIESETPERQYALIHGEDLSALRRRARFNKYDKGLLKAWLALDTKELRDRIRKADGIAEGFVKAFRNRIKS